MPFYSDDELRELPEFDDLAEALQNPGKVIRLRLDRHEDAAALARIAELRNLQSLSISLSDVSRLLPGLEKLEDLQKLDLQRCQISAFPENILGLLHLRSLSMGNNALEQLPADLGRLINLQELRLSQNDLQRIPESIGQLTELKTLGLSSNQLEDLPESLLHLVKLEDLFLDGNRLQRLPDNIGKLNRLQFFSVKYNELTTLPDSICQLRELKSLSLEGNPFVSLPSCLAEITNTETLSIEAAKRSLYMDWSYRPSAKPPQMELSELKLFVSPDTKIHKALTAAIKKARLKEVEPAIVEAARDAVAIYATKKDNYSELGNSRLGGFPDLPDPALFPKTDDCYWIFLAQINLADIAPLNSYLPRRGLLSFFLDSTEALNGKVLFYEGDPQVLKAVRHEGAEEMVSPDDDYTQTPHRVKFERIFSLPHKPPGGIQDDEAIETYHNCEALTEGVDHHINGYTFTQRESPQEQAAANLRGQPNEWVPLLQLGWDGKVGFCFWDAGTVTFTIHQEDLRRWDFSRVHVSLESS